jgi:hypothetical protein
MKLDDLVVNQTTRSFLDSYTVHPKQGVLLSGTKGSGLCTTAMALAASITTHSSNIMFVGPDEKGTISIERVRALYVETRSIRSEHFAVVIDDVESMSHDAQNSFLKLLEEPVDNVHFILTAHEPQMLLATILSRVPTIEIGKISQTASESLLRAHHVTAATALQQMLFIASGHPAELVRLADNKEHFETEAKLVRLARDFLTTSSYERLALISQISGREEAREFVETIANVLRFTSERDVEAAKNTPANALETVAARLSANGHVRTQLMYLATHVV